MRPGTDRNVSLLAIKCDVARHSQIRIEANFVDADRDGSLVGKLEKRSPVSLPLLRRANRDAVHQQVIRSLLEHRDAYVTAFAVQNPHLAAIDLGAVILLGGFRDVA
jgi:hypothetical protein